MSDWRKPFREIPVGKGRLIRKGNDIAILSIGHPGNMVSEACELLDLENISLAHYDMRFVKPFDSDLLSKVFKRFNHIITIEDGTITGGFGSAVLEFMTESGFQANVKRLGVPDRFIDHGTQQELYKECGFDVEGIVQSVQSMIKKQILSKVG